MAKIKFLLFLLLNFVYVISYSQKGYEIGGWIGTSYYFGDLNNTLKITKPGLALGILGRYNFNDRIAVKTSLNYGRVGADDANSDNYYERNRNLSFRSNVFDLTNVIEFNFFKYEHGSSNHNKTPYFFGGFNIFYFNPEALLNDQKFYLNDYNTEGQVLGSEYSLFSGGLVLGGGFKIDLSRDISLNIEASTRFLFTDYLDDVSTVFPDKIALNTLKGPNAVALSDRSLIDGIGEAGRQRGDTKGKDKFTFFGVSLVKYFGGIECPKISRAEKN